MRVFSSILLLLMLPAVSHGWQLRVGKIQSAGVAVHAVNASRNGDQLVVDVEQVSAADLALQQSKLSLTCTLRDSGSAGVLCTGDISAKTPAWRGLLSFSRDAEQTEVQVSVGRARLSLQTSSAPAAAHIRVQAAPLEWVQSRIAELWPDLASISGSVDADLLLPDAGRRLSGALALHDLAFDSRLGDVAGSALQLGGEFTMQWGDRTEVSWRAARPSGQVLLGPVYFELPNAESQLEIQAVTDANGAWQLPLIAWRDGEGLNLRVAVRWEGDRLDARVTDFSARLASVSQRYLGTALATSGYEGLLLEGEAKGRGRFFDGAWKSFELELHDMRIADPAERIQVARLDGALRMDSVAAINNLQWQGARIYRIPVGDGAARWHWSPERLQLAEPLSIALLGGTLRIPKLERSRVDGASDWRGSIELGQLDVLNLATALDWPHFSGTLSGSLPGFHFRSGGFSAEGDIQLSVFDGQLSISGLNSERTFGVAPSLSADIRFDNLDLKQLSAAMDFGEVEGWLDGEVAGLRMLDWSPIAFDAHLRTDSDYPGKQRISQRAVQGLSSVGGGGAVGNPMMRLIDRFPYADIGLNCRLAENICHMSGLEPSGSGYTIVRGSGIPRLTVIGHQRRVDWPVLLARLQAASSGQAPVID